jgi:acyl CoA:acetate/3-ketoacid CoA transferase beta subunit
LTGKGVIDLIVTELAVFTVNDPVYGTGLTLIERAEETTIEEIQRKTEADFRIADDLKVF